MLVKSVGHKTRDEGCSSAYDARERNAVSARFCQLICRLSEGTATLRAVCFVRLVAKGINHSLPRLSRIPSRKVAVAPTVGLFRGSP
ncbi:MAG: hypothetical protein ABI865_08825 [Nitrosospira sp.]